MRAVKPYLRERAVEYARRWAFSRNPLFYDYTGIGGNCTNFISQCLYAGGCVMNFTPVYGWYYLDPDARSAAWTGVEFLYDFLITNMGPGPFAQEVNPGGLEIGDVIQLANADGDYYHTLLVTGFADDTYLVAAQSNDAFDRPLNTYEYADARFLHILGIGVEYVPEDDCYEALLEGQDITAQPPMDLPMPEVPDMPEALPVMEVPSEEDVPPTNERQSLSQARGTPDLPRTTSQRG